jgi:mono/diheme cytochrome c family protein
MENRKNRRTGKTLFLTFALVTAGLFTGCSNKEDEQQATSQQVSSESAAVSTPVPADDGKGVGPVKNVTVGPIAPKLVAEGKKVFEAKCTACHNIASKKVGPALIGVTQRRKPEWIMNMILNPGEMTQKDPTAKKLYSELLVQMANQNAGQDGARAILEYFRDNDAKKGK